MRRMKKKKSAHSTQNDAGIYCEEIMKILLITEQREGKWNKVGFETLAAAQQVAQQTKGSLSAVVIGKGIAALADELAGYQMEEVLLVEHDLLGDYTPDGFTIALKQVIEGAKPD